MAKKIFILSLSHSGSTLLDLLLGCHSQLVSLGKVHATIKNFAEPQSECTCGKKSDQCEVWGRFREKLNATKSTDYYQTYNLLIYSVGEVYHQDKIIVDSSKGLKALKSLVEGGMKDLYILFLIKDIRSFIFSGNYRKHSKEKMKKDGWRRIYRTSTLRNSYKWYQRNKQIKEYLEKNKLSYFQLGYEELCFRPKEILRKISDFVGIDYEEQMLYPQNSESHILTGNDMRFNKEKLKNIRYDTRWLMSRKLTLLSMLYFPLMEWNNQNVYSNIGH